MVVKTFQNKIPGFSRFSKSKITKFQVIFIRDSHKNIDKCQKNVRKKSQNESRNVNMCRECGDMLRCVEICLDGS